MGRELLGAVEKSTIQISNRWRASEAIKIRFDDTEVKMYSKCDDPYSGLFLLGTT